MATSRVLLVDERRLLTSGLAHLLRDHPLISEVQVLQDRAALPAALNGLWDVVVCSEQFAESVLAQKRSQTRVLALLHDPDVTRVAALLRLGASGVCTSEDEVEDVAQAIAQVARWEVRLPMRLVAGVLEELQQQQTEADTSREILSRLTDRERDVLEGLGRGQGRTEIGRELGLSPNTVRTHVQHLLRKIELHSQLEAAAFARALTASLAAPNEPSSARVVDLNASRSPRDPQPADH